MIFPAKKTMTEPDKCEKCVLINSLKNSIDQAESLKRFYLKQIISGLVTQEKPKLPDKHNLN